MFLGIRTGIPSGADNDVNPQIPAAPTMVENPVVSGSSVVGSILSTTDGSWTGFPLPTFAYQWRRDAVDISGATGSAYTTVGPADVGAAIDCVVTATNSQGSANADSNDIAITQAPANAAAPVVSGNATVGSVLSTTNGTWTGTPAPSFSYQWRRDGVAISGAIAATYTTVDPMDVGTAIDCLVTATNSAGSASADSNDIAVISGVSLPPPSTTLQSSVTYRGVTFNFSTPKPVFYDVMGQPCVLNDSGAWTITSITPISELETGYVKNGAMLDPLVLYQDPTYGEHGFDSSITLIPYNAALNDDPAINGAIAITAGSNHMLVKCVRSTQWLGNPDEREVMDKYVALTILSALPPHNDFYRPGITNADQTIRYKSDVNMGVFRSLTPPISGLPAAQNVFNYMGPGTDYETLPWFGPTGEVLRSFWVESETMNGYSGDYVVQHAMPCYLLHSSAVSAQDKEALADIVIRNGLDIYSRMEKGFVGTFGAGQHHGYSAFLYFLGFMFGDAAIVTAAEAEPSNMQDHPRWIKSTDVGADMAFPASQGQLARYRMTYFVEDEDFPFWSEPWRGSQPSARYFPITAHGIGCELLPVLLLVNGPGAKTGYTSYLRGGSYDTANERAAGIALHDYWKTHGNGWPRNYNGLMDGVSIDCYQMWDVANWRDEIPLARWVGRPSMVDPAYSGLGQNFFTATAGGISWDIAQYGNTFSNQPVTDVSVRYSIDGVQFVEVSGQSTTGSLSGLLPGVDHYCQIALTNASGRGKWSVNYPFSAVVADIGNRNVVQPTGTPANAAPVVTTTPAIHYKPYTSWLGEYFEPAPATLNEDIVVLYAGAGYYTGYPAPTFTYQWKRGGVNIGGATSQSYTLTTSDFDAVITCDVTATNGSGTITTTTAGVTVFSQPVLPADTVIDTNFQAAFPLFYPNVDSSIVVSGATLERQPQVQYISDEPTSIETTTGGIQADKTGSFPYFDINLTAERVLQAGATYQIDLDLPLGYPSDNPAHAFLDARYRLGRSAGDATYSSADYALLDIANQPKSLRLSKTLLVAQSETALDLWFRPIAWSNVGGGSQGNPTISNAVVRKVVEPLARNNHIRQFVTGSDDLRDVTQSVTLPAGIVAGNQISVLLRFGVGRGITAVPLGWSLVASSADNTCHLYQKIADAMDAGTTVSWTTDNAIRCAYLVVENAGPLKTASVEFSTAVESVNFTPIPTIDLGASVPAGFVVFSSSGRTTPAPEFFSESYSDVTTWFSGTDNASDGNNSKAIAGWLEKTAQTEAPSRVRWATTLFDPCCGVIAYT